MLQLMTYRQDLRGDVVWCSYGCGTVDLAIGVHFEAFFGALGMRLILSMADPSLEIFEKREFLLESLSVEVCY